MTQQTREAVAMWCRLHNTGYPEQEPAPRGFAEWVRKLVGLYENDDVLDIGCGCGQMMLALAPRVRSIVGIDIHPAPLRRAEEVLQGEPNTCTVLSDGITLPGTIGDFDLIYSTNVFQHLMREQVRRYLEEMDWLLKPGGRILVQFSKKATRKDVDPRIQREQSVQWRPRDLAKLAQETGTQFLDNKQLYGLRRKP